MALVALEHEALAALDVLVGDTGLDTEDDKGHQGGCVGDSEEDFAVEVALQNVHLLQKLVKQPQHAPEGRTDEKRISKGKDRRAFSGPERAPNHVSRALVVVSEGITGNRGRGALGQHIYGFPGLVDIDPRNREIFHKTPVLNIQLWIHQRILREHLLLPVLELLVAASVGCEAERHSNYRKTAN